MDEAARARAAARDSVADIVPAPLHELLDARLERAAMTPAVLTRLAARAAGREVDPDVIDRRAAGVQLIYDGLRLTRTLARAPPWPDGDVDRADIDIVAADVLVARGFRLLARTEAAWKAVETVRAFGRDETVGANAPASATHALEADVFELAIIAGMAAAGVEPPTGVRPFAVDLADSIEGDRPTPPELLSEPTVEALADLAADRDRSSATPDRIWAGSGATDP